jgi:DNA-binding NtrC family response regulator
MGNKEKVLLIDDDRYFAENILIALGEDYELVHCLNFATARAAVKKKDAAVILLDIKIPPDGSGLDLIVEIKEVDNDVPIILVSATDSPHAVADAFKLGVVDFIAKTFLDSKKVVETIRYVISTKGRKK